jgi:hypothetical protein
MTPGQPTYREHQPSAGTVATDRACSVFAATRIEAAPRAEERADESLVSPNRDQQRPADRGADAAASSHDSPNPGTAGNATRRSARSTSAPNCADVAPAAVGSARTTIRADAGKAPSLVAITCRSCRFTRLRTTAFPTPRPTTNPTRGCSTPAWSAGAVPTSTWTTTHDRPARRPCRMVAAKSERRRKRDAAGNMRSPGPQASGRQDLAALTATTGKNGAPGTSAHTQPKTMRFRPAAVIRLERALAHSGAPG